MFYSVDFSWCSWERVRLPTQAWPCWPAFLAPLCARLIMQRSPGSQKSVPFQGIYMPSFLGFITLSHQVALTYSRSSIPSDGCPCFPKICSPTIMSEEEFHLDLESSAKDVGLKKLSSLATPNWLGISGLGSTLIRCRNQNSGCKLKFQRLNTPQKGNHVPALQHFFSFHVTLIVTQVSLWRNSQIVLVFLQI